MPANARTVGRAGCRADLRVLTEHSQPAPRDCAAWCNDHTYYVTAERAFGVISRHRAARGQRCILEVTAGRNGMVGLYVHDVDELSVDRARVFAGTILAGCDALEGSAPTL
jgi:hypothetical protein